jgi:hypothetical protein
MSQALEKRIKDLEKALLALQKLSADHYETLANDFSNRAESQYNLVKYLFKQYQVMKEVIGLMTKELNLAESRVSNLWSEAKDKAASVSIQDDLLADYQKELEKEHGRS